MPAAMRSSPPSGIASRALAARLSSTCSIWPRSATIHFGSGDGSTTRAMSDAQQAAEHRLHRADRFVEVEGGRQQHALAAEGEQLTGQPGGAAAGGEDLLEVLAHRAVGFEDRQHRLAQAVDDHQHVVEVVRDAAGEAAQGLHLLRLAHLPFEVLARRVVEDVAVDRHQLAVAVEAPDQALDDRHDAAVDARQRALVLTHGAVAPDPLDHGGEAAVGVERAEVGAERVGERRGSRRSGRRRDCSCGSGRSARRRRCRRGSRRRPGGSVRRSAAAPPRRGVDR